MGLEFEDFKRNRVEGAIVSFIRGKKNEKWVMGIINGKWGVKGVDLQKIFDKIPTTYINYDKNLLNQLKQKCLHEGLL